MDTESPLVVLLGNVDHEGIVSALKTSGYVYKKKILESSRSNWESIIGLLQHVEVEAVLVKLNTAAFDLIAEPNYQTVGDYLLSSIAKKRSIVFVYDDLWFPSETQDIEPDGVPDDEGRYYRVYSSHRYGVPEQEVMELVRTKLIGAGISPVPYSTNAQLTVMGAQFIRDIAARLLFRIYIPHGRLYAVEIDKVLQLFKDFLDNTGRRGITFNKVAAEQGTSFEFCGEYEQNANLADDFQDFSQFMEMCVSDVDKARNMLSVREIGGGQVTKIVERYAKEARRLFLDIKHERESKILDVRHRFESELVEFFPSETGLDFIRSIVDENIPIPKTLDEVMSGTKTQHSHANVTINMNSQVIDKAYGLISRELNGNVNLGTQGEELLEFINKYGGDRAAQLASDVHEIADKGIPEGTRMTRRQQLKSFLYGLKPELTKLGMNLLEEYLKKKILG